MIFSSGFKNHYAHFLSPSLLGNGNPSNSKESCSYIARNGNPKAETLKKLLIFQEVTCKTQKTNKKVCFEEGSCLLC